MKHYGAAFFRDWKSPNSYDPDFAPLPDGPGVYLLVTCDLLANLGRLKYKILYAGKSMRLANRCGSRHEVYSALREKYDYVKIFFKPLPARQIRDEEVRLIQSLGPPYNLIHRLKGEPR